MSLPETRTLCDIGLLTKHVIVILVQASKSDRKFGISVVLSRFHLKFVVCKNFGMFNLE